MNNPKVSVIVPVYNTEAYVEEAVRSIMDQTLSDIEIIVVNDGSTDNSPAVIARLAAEDPRIVVHTQVNKGLSEARNAGIDRAKGEFIYFMDSDDLLEGDTLECCCNRCEEHRLDFVFFDAESFGVDVKLEAWHDYRRAKYFKENFYSGQNLLREMLDRNCYRASACLSFIRLSFLKKLGLRFYPGILHEDELFTPLLYLQSERIGGIERAFFHRRLREGSIMAINFSMRNFDGYMTVIRKLSAFSRQQSPGSRKIIARLIRMLLRNIMNQGWVLPAAVRWQLAGESVRHYPGCIDYKSLFVLLCKKALKK